METLARELTASGIAAGILAAAAVLAGLIHLLIFGIIGRVARRTASAIDDLLVRHSRRPALLLFAVLADLLAAPLVPLSPRALSVVQHLLSLLLILAVAWLLVGGVHAARDLLLAQYRIDVADNLRARKIQTQAKVLVRIARTVIGLLAMASMLMVFAPVRQLGGSILASAGIVGVVVGFAAQRSLGTLIAGVQIAVTQPIRLDDVVIVEGEWGRVEEITLTYVVVRIWDLRRLIVPITHFIERPFQNWTRVSADLLGTVFLYVDYAVDVQGLREELLSVLRASGKWDGKVWGVQVTGGTERTMELRALMSAADSSSAWELRCEVREKLIAFLRRSHPGAFPRLRVEQLGGAQRDGSRETDPGQ